MVRAQSKEIDQMARWYRQGLPAGQRYHAAGQAEGGVLIVTVWDSKEDADRFVAKVLMPNVSEAGGLSGKPEELSAEVFNLLTQ